MEEVVNAICARTRKIKERRGIMISLLKIVLSANFWIGFAVSALGVVGYLYSTGSTLKWKR